MYTPNPNLTEHASHVTMSATKRKFNENAVVSAVLY